MCKAILALWVILKSLFVRILFTTLSIICIWRVVAVYNNLYYWFLSLTLILLFIESFFTLLRRQGKEYKWICPSVFFYLLSVVPAIWLLETALLEDRLAVNENRTSVFSDKNGTGRSSLEKYIPLSFPDEDWSRVLTQIILLLLIIGRWLLPKGELTRDQLSQLLLVYVGVAADILEIFDSFNEKEVQDSAVLSITVLALWSWSLLQFVFVLTATRGPRVRPGATLDINDGSAEGGGGNICCSTDLWAAWLSIMLMDLPFLVFRMLLIFHFGIVNTTVIFFTIKNGLIVMLQWYRSIVVVLEKRRGPKPPADASKTIEQSTSADPPSPPSPPPPPPPPPSV